MALPALASFPLRQSPYLEATSYIGDEGKRSDRITIYSMPPSYVQFFTFVWTRISLKNFKAYILVIFYIEAHKRKERRLFTRSAMAKRVFEPFASQMIHGDDVCYSCWLEICVK
jgi:hypothetical protein